VACNYEPSDKTQAFGMAGRGLLQIRLGEYCSASLM